MNNNYVTKVPFLERNTAWINKKFEKLNQKKEGNEDLELEKYTFQPKISKNLNIHVTQSNNINSKDIQKHLERQLKARNEKIRKEQVLKSNNRNYINKKYAVEGSSLNVDNAKRNIVRGVEEIKPDNYVIDEEFRNTLEEKYLATNINLLHKYLNNINIY